MRHYLYFCGNYHFLQTKKVVLTSQVLHPTLLSPFFLSLFFSCFVCLSNTFSTPIERSRDRAAGAADRKLGTLLLSLSLSISFFLYVPYFLSFSLSSRVLVSRFVSFSCVFFLDSLCLHPMFTPLPLSSGDARASELARLCSLFILRRSRLIQSKFLKARTESVLFCGLSELQACFVSFSSFLHSRALRL